MTRLALVGVGIPAFMPGRDHAGPGLRSAHFAVSAARAGHEVLLLCLIAEGRELPQAFDFDLDGRDAAAAGRIRCVFVYEKGFPGEDGRRELEAFAPEALVGVTAYAASVALRLRLDIPMWADVFGDLMAEAQAKAVASGSDACLVHFWSLLSPVLERADRFSAVSEAQAHALVGQLGIAGRLSRATAGEDFVGVIPCAAEPTSAKPLPAPGPGDFRLRGSIVPRDAHVVLWTGGFNTWCDVDALALGVEKAMAADDKLHFVVTGGAIPGHDERTYARFTRLVERSPFTDRVHLLGWIDSVDLPVCYAEADLGVVVERDVYERRFGSENRAVQWMAAGLPFVTTALSEFGTRACETGCAYRVRLGSAESLGEVLAGAFADCEALARASAKCRELAASEFGYETSAASFLAWAGEPRFAADHGRERVVRPGLLSQPEALADVLEAYLAGLSVPELGRRSTRWLWRRLRGTSAFSKGRS